MFRNLLFAFVIVLSAGLVPAASADAPATSYKVPDYKTPKNAGDKGYVAHGQFKDAAFTPGVISRFMFDGWAGKKIPVWVYVPEGTDTTQAPIMFMMHGAQRNPARYLIEWMPHAQEYGFVVVAPEFNKDHFTGSRAYNQGRVFKSKGVRRDESLWTFSAIEPIFDYTVNALNSSQTQYTLYGHSAGSQFTHRYLYFKPDARVKRYLAANAGWYTMPDLEEEYPYGFKNSTLSKEALKDALQKDMIVLLGDKDIVTNHRSLRRTPEAMRQGEHRYNRGISYLEKGREQAEAFGVDYGWRGMRVPDVAHSNGGIAKAAAPYVK